MEGISTSPNVGHSIKAKQVQLYQMCHDYLIDNFHKFTDANKLKVALSLATKLAPQEIEGKLEGAGNNQVVIWKEIRETVAKSSSQIEIERVPSA